MRKLFFIGICTVLFWSCSLREENEQLKLQNEELQGDLENSLIMSRTLEDIGILLDSIDESRNMLRLDLETGTSYRDFTLRMEEINDYVKITENRIAELERSMGEAADANSVYISSMRRLKQELERKSRQLEELQQMVADYADENEALMNLVDLQDAEIEDKQYELEVKREELNFLEIRIEELMIRSQMTRADAYFARAQAVEEAARRTRLAPKKKKETLGEALELYQKAFDEGKTEAEAKIKELQARI